MSRYTVAPGHEFNYPADVESLKILQKAGGHSKLSEADRDRVKTKTVTEGTDCSDMPADTLALYVERGWVLEQSEQRSQTSTEAASTPAVAPFIERRAK